MPPALPRDAGTRAFIPPTPGPRWSACVLGAPNTQTQGVLEYVAEVVYPALMRTPDEIGNLLRGTGGQVRPAPAPAARPPAAWPTSCPPGATSTPSTPRPFRPRRRGRRASSWPSRCLDKYLEEEGAYPEMVGLVVWGTSAMRTHGDDIAQILHLLGVRPKWQAESRRVLGIEVIPAGRAGAAPHRRYRAHQRLLPRRLPQPDQPARPGRGAGRVPGRVARETTTSSSTSGRTCPANTAGLTV